MTDFWADRIPLNQRLEVHKDDQQSMRGSTQGTVEGNGMTAEPDPTDSAPYVDISNNFKTKQLSDPPADRQF